MLRHAHVQALAALFILAGALSAATPPDSPEALVRSLYNKVVALHPLDVSVGGHLKDFAPYLSKALIHKIEVSNACIDDWYRQNPDPTAKPPGLEGGLFTGDGTRAEPEAFYIENVHAERDGSIRVQVRLSRHEPGENRWTWSVAAVLVRESGQLAVDDVIYLKDRPQDIEVRLSDYLSQGCDGPHWVGHGEPPNGDAQAYLESLVSVMLRGEAGKVKIIHLSDSIETLIGVTKGALRQLANYDLDFTDELAEKFAPLLCGVSVKKEHHQPDLRWGIFFYDRKGLLIASLFVDPFGQYGYLNDENVLFETGSTERNLAKDLHRITGIRD